MSTALLDALRSIADRPCRMTTRPMPVTVGTAVEQLIVVYPPGAPIAVPGEIWTSAHQCLLEACQRDGVDVYALPQPYRRTGQVDGVVT